MFSNQSIQHSCQLLAVGKAEILTVAEVESGGSGFLASGEPVILYEPFKFGLYSEHVYDGTTVSIKGSTYPLSLSGTWSIFRAKYGTPSIQHSKLHAASELNRDAALRACSWGKFQILGDNWKMLGYPSLQEFVNCMYKDEDQHLLAFSRYIHVNNLAKALQSHDWVTFAKGYNGPRYKDNCYDGRLAKVFTKYSRT